MSTFVIFKEAKKMKERGDTFVPFILRPLTDSLLWIQSEEIVRRWSQQRLPEFKTSDDSVCDNPVS